MTLASRLTRCPLPFDPALGAEAHMRYSDLAPELAALIAGTAGCSPYLNTLLVREADWLRAALADTPEAATAQELDRVRTLELPDLNSELRRAKRRIALLSALADLGGVWSLEQVTQTLSDFADAAVDICVKNLISEEIRRKKLPGMTQDDAQTAGGMVALAMGKMGAGELNYSSDIDLICLFDQSRLDPDDLLEARSAYVRATRKMSQILSDVTAEGYVFRTDLRLRPDASATPVCLSMASAELYYEAEGRTWERAAYIKARAAAGDVVAGQAFLRTLRPFVWRRHLDFAAIQDAHDMRLRIRDHKGLHGDINVPGHNMKLGPGGIREIEFFTQTRQLIAGGRDSDLRGRTTVGGLAALARKSWVPDDIALSLTQHYRAHREVEHRLQMVNDSQTQTLPTSAEGLARIAAMMGEGDAQRWADQLRARLQEVEQMTGEFFAPTPAPARPKIDDRATQIITRWHSYPCLKSERARVIFARLEPELLCRMKRAANFDEALLQFDGFLKGLPAGVQLFSLFESNPVLIDLIVDICATAPALASYLSRNSSVLDAVLGGSFFEPWHGIAALEDDLDHALSVAQDYERQLDASRAWAKEWKFRVGVHHLRGLIDAEQAAHYYADIAGVAMERLWPLVLNNFEARHGAAPGRGAVLLGMGSLGAERLNAASDLDLIVIYDAQGDEASQGRKPLSTRAYYARLTQAMITAVTAPMPQGRLYEVDMRLRPSGRQGPVATSLQSFTNYQMTEAWTWEHLALTRARPIAGRPGLATDLEATRLEVLTSRGTDPRVQPDLAEMRARLFAAKPATSPWEAKNGPGRLQDLELFAQCLALRTARPQRQVKAQLSCGAKAGLITTQTAQTLSQNYDILWRLQAATRLLTEEGLDMDAIGEGGRSFVLRECNAASLEELAKTLHDVTSQTAQIIEEALVAQWDDEL
ncbi:glutamine-synthetase adenylyltransferase [Thioclava sp. SK-1]|uniref:[protein-PII] uridylyltransferase family protein n=1 Tax=Thioclava sp. SK-1 TaxID=1889770 RepID=UPI00082550D0|nr:glutamine-synthetase adenylyltransferase [Thioclava sp. SK-1]OCX61429.1 glutamine-synthetase adenylyltransferase [Thioclava sp. SK-1]